jgi:hypothetical protein
MHMRRLTAHLLPRLSALVSAFVLALGTTSVQQNFHAPPPSHDSQAELAGVLTAATVETPWPERFSPAWGEHWVFRRREIARESDVNQSIAAPAPDPGTVNFGCVTLRVAVDAARRLTLNGDDLGSLDDPRRLTELLTAFFREREMNRAYKPGTEYRSDIPSDERIEKTVVIVASASLGYGEVLELLSLVERAGASPVVLQVGAEMKSFQETVS